MHICIIMPSVPVIKVTAFAQTCLDFWFSGVLVEDGVCLITFGLTDHDVAVFALPPIIKALHLDIVRGLWLEMSNQVPVFCTWERRKREMGTKVSNHFLYDSHCSTSFMRCSCSFMLALSPPPTPPPQSHQGPDSYFTLVSSIYGSVMFILACLQ